MAERSASSKRAPEQMQCNDAFRRDLDGLGPELEFWVDGAVQHEVGRVGVERTDWRVMAHLLTNHAVAQLLPATQQLTFRLSSWYGNS